MLINYEEKIEKFEQMINKSERQVLFIKAGFQFQTCFYATTEMIIL
jgi:hypothetical protein